MFAGRLIRLMSAALVTFSSEVATDGGFNSHVPAKRELPVSSGPNEPRTLQQYAYGALRQATHSTLKPTILLLAAVASGLAAAFVILTCYRALGSARNADSQTRRLAGGGGGKTPCQVGRGALLTSSVLGWETSAAHANSKLSITRASALTLLYFYSMTQLGGSAATVTLYVWQVRCNRSAESGGKQRLVPTRSRFAAAACHLDA